MRRWFDVATHVGVDAFVHTGKLDVVRAWLSSSGAIKKSLALVAEKAGEVGRALWAGPRRDDARA
jgi:hypothetical protein